MADITIVRRNHYSGLDADKPATANISDTFFSTDKGKFYYWDGSAWKTGLGFEFVPRSVNVVDFTLLDFVTDGTWKINGLDLSSIIPAGAVSTLLSVAPMDDTANAQFFVRQSATQQKSGVFPRTPAVNIADNRQGVVNLDSDRLVDYFGTNLTFTSIDITVLGWWI